MVNRYRIRNMLETYRQVVGLVRRRLLKAVTIKLEKLRLTPPDSLAEALTESLLENSKSRNGTSENNSWGFRLYAYAPNCRGPDWDTMKEIQDDILFHSHGTVPVEDNKKVLEIANIDRIGLFHRKKIEFDCGDNKDLMILEKALPSGAVSYTGLLPLLSSQNILEGGTGCHEWEAGFYLSEYILNHAKYFAGKRCLELGSGVGLVGIILARIGASEIWCTDGDTDAVQNCLQNFELNGVINREISDPIEGIIEAQDGKSRLEPIRKLCKDRTDQHPVNSSVHETNIEYKKTVKSQPIAFVRQLKWETSWIDKQTEARISTSTRSGNFDPEIILGADLLYDPEVIPTFVRLLGEMLMPSNCGEHHNGNPKSITGQKCAIIATTIRNELTFQRYMEQVQKYHGVDTNGCFKLCIDDISLTARKIIEQGTQFCHITNLEAARERIVLQRITRESMC